MFTIKDGVVTSDNDERVGTISDGYHTFDDLYAHRQVLTAALFNLLNITFDKFENKSEDTLMVGKSRNHHPDDDPMFEDSFIVFCVIYDSEEDLEYQFSYHYKPHTWDEFQIPEYDHAPKWDGSTPDDSLDIIRKYLN